MENEQTNGQGKSILQRGQEIGGDVHAGLGFSTMLWGELAGYCEDGDFYFGNAELQASRLHLDAIKQALTRKAGPIIGRVIRLSPPLMPMS
jgi:hypothetical protein